MKIMFNVQYSILNVAIVLLLLCSCHRATLKEQCAEMVKKEWRRMPRNITMGVVLDSLHYEERSNTLVYYHTMDDTLYTEEMIRLGKHQLHEQLLLEISNSVALKRLKDEGVSFRYVYMASSTGKECLSLDFNNEDL
ncbi:MAG: hypothetical protein J6W50_00030 [Bacteroidaceae bacterium]|nr:hypothetical protein [Bacteroidaceae bacterium]